MTGGINIHKPTILIYRERKVWTHSHMLLTDLTISDIIGGYIFNVRYLICRMSRCHEICNEFIHVFSAIDLACPLQHIPAELTE